MSKTRVNPVDKWSQAQTNLEALAKEQVTADIEMINTERALKLAEQAHKRAISRKTLAEQRLTSARSKLGEE
jgi:hypothetical protein